MYNQQWYTILTYWYIGLYSLFILIYWIADFEFFILKIIYKNISFGSIIIYLIFYVSNISYMAKRGAVYPKVTMEYMDIYAQNSVYKYFYYLKNDLKKFYLNFLNDEWYKYQLNYNKYFKTLFIIFLNIFSIIVLFIQILFYYLYIYFFFFFIHFPWTFILIIFEYNKSIIVLNFIYFIFIYFLIISIFLKNTNGIWIFFFYKYHFKWRYVDILYFSDQDYLFFHDMIYLYITLIRHNFYVCKSFKGFQKKNRKDSNWIILFNDDYINDRIWIPMPWRTFKYSEISCFVNSFFFKFWTYKLDIILYLVFPYQFMNYIQKYGFFSIGFGRKISETISYKKRGTADYSIKKYKFK